MPSKWAARAVVQAPVSPGARMFWRYDLEDSLAYLAEVWLRPTSRPVLFTVAGITVAMTLLTRLASL